jgi:hypothetical protein
MPNAQSESARRVGWGRRLSYAFIGLVAGNAAMDAYLLTGMFGLLFFPQPFAVELATF